MLNKDLFKYMIIIGNIEIRTKQYFIIFVFYLHYSEILSFGFSKEFNLTKILIL